MAYRILTINPGSTSTKITIFEDTTPILEKKLNPSPEEAENAGDFNTVLDIRRRVILRVLAESGFDVNTLNCVVGRGGLTRPVESGVYAIDEKMLTDLSEARFGWHACNFGAGLAYGIATPLGLPSYMADPGVVNETEPLARFSGYPAIERRTIWHALNTKAVARRVSASRGFRYEDKNFIIAHIGGGVSVGAHRRGRVVDVNNALDGDGPFSAERGGSLPVRSVVELAMSGKYKTVRELVTELITNGGVKGYLGTNDGREVARRIDEGDEYARLVYEAMAYQIAKEIGSLAAVLKGDVDYIILTGGMAHDDRLMGWIKERVGFIAEVVVVPGEDEMRALCEAGIRALSGEEKVKTY